MVPDGTLSRWERGVAAVEVGEELGSGGGGAGGQGTEEKGADEVAGGGVGDETVVADGVTEQRAEEVFDEFADLLALHDVALGPGVAAAVAEQVVEGREELVVGGLLGGGLRERVELGQLLELDGGALGGLEELDVDGRRRVQGLWSKVQGRGGGVWRRRLRLG